jgi:hypothetical protein
MCLSRRGRRLLQCLPLQQSGSAWKHLNYAARPCRPQQQQQPLRPRRWRALRLWLQRRRPMIELVCNEIYTPHYVSGTGMQPALSVTRAGPGRINRNVDIELFYIKASSISKDKTLILVYGFERQYRRIIDIDASRYRSRNVDIYVIGVRQYRSTKH